MLDAFLLGAAAQSSLVLSGLAVYLVKVPQKVVGAFAGFGAGALIAAIAFDLIPQGEGLEYGQLALWLLIGGGVFIVTRPLSHSAAAATRTLPPGLRLAVGAARPAHPIVPLRAGMLRREAARFQDPSRLPCKAERTRPRGVRGPRGASGTSETGAGHGSRARPGVG